MNASSPGTFDAYLRETLPWVDKRFANDGRPVRERPLAAARFIVDHLVVGIRGGTKDDYLTKPWFAGIYQSVCKWYERRYGKVLTRSRQAHARGLVVYFGTPCLIRVPLVVTEPGNDGTAWVKFLKEVMPDEDPLGWIEDPPPLEDIPAKSKRALAASAANVATCLRRINNDLNTADLGDSAVAAMASTVMRHLNKAAVDAVADDREAGSLAIWELQMACEKTMKSYLAQKGVVFPQTHNLRNLQKLALEDTELSEAKKAMATMPSERRVIAWRYSELPPPHTRDLYRFYGAALTICRVYAGRMTRRYVFNNFAIQLRRPAWLGET